MKEALDRQLGRLLAQEARPAVRVAAGHQPCGVKRSIGLRSPSIELGPIEHTHVHDRTGASRARRGRCSPDVRKLTPVRPEDASGPGTAARRPRIGVFGGTFDPVHVGHLVAAVGARDALDLDRVRLVVANQPWQKHDRSVSPAEHRLEMLAAAVAGVDGLEASAIEIERGGESFTADTLDAMSDAEPDSDLFLVVGADVVADLPTWRRVDDVARLATLVVVTRPGAPHADPGPGWTTERVEIPGLDVSATDLRKRAAAGQSLDFLVPTAAIDVIRRLNLYAGDR